MAYFVACPECGKVKRIYVEEDIEARTVSCPDCQATIINHLGKNDLDDLSSPTTITAHPDLDTQLTTQPARRSIPNLKLHQWAYNFRHGSRPAVYQILLAIYGAFAVGHLLVVGNIVPVIANPSVAFCVILVVAFSVFLSAIEPKFLVPRCVLWIFWVLGSSHLGLLCLLLCLLGGC